jgi:hypothetical protein
VDWSQYLVQLDLPAGLQSLTGGFYFNQSMKKVVGRTDHIFQ